MESLGRTIKELREANEMPLRKVAAFLDIDQAILSKYEHGSRTPKREQIIKLAAFFKEDKTALLIQWLAEKIFDELKDEEVAVEALQLVEERLKNTEGNLHKDFKNSASYLKLGETLSKESVKWGNKLPSFTEIARSLFTTLTGEKFNEKAVNNQTGYIGESKTHEVYLFYKPNEEWLKNNALTLNKIKELPEYTGKTRMVFASLKYVNGETCKLHYIDFYKLPY